MESQMNRTECVFSWAVALLFLSLVGGCVYLVGKSAREEGRENRRRIKEATVSESEFAKTVIHDGHWWVVWYGMETVTHHPDCPCGKGQAEKN